MVSESWQAVITIIIVPSYTGCSQKNALKGILGKTGCHFSKMFWILKLVVYILSFKKEISLQSNKKLRGYTTYFRIQTVWEYIILSFFRILKGHFLGHAVYTVYSY